MSGKDDKDKETRDRDREQRNRDREQREREREGSLGDSSTMPITGEVRKRGIAASPGISVGRPPVPVLCASIAPFGRPRLSRRRPVSLSVIAVSRMSVVHSDKPASRW